MKVKSNKFNLFLDLTISNVVDISICLDIHEKAAISLISSDLLIYCFMHIKNEIKNHYQVPYLNMPIFNGKRLILIM